MFDDIRFYTCKDCDCFAIIPNAECCASDGAFCDPLSENMEFLEAQTADWATEKHVPIVEMVEGGIKVVVGSTLHPMEEKHYIMGIGIVHNGMIALQKLKPGDAPEAFFPVSIPDIQAFEVCNVHGLWKN